jgi:hypothetical protein
LGDYAKEKSRSVPWHTYSRSFFFVILDDAGVCDLGAASSGETRQRVISSFYLEDGFLTIRILEEIQRFQEFNHLPEGGFRYLREPPKPPQFTLTTH